MRKLLRFALSCIGVVFLALTYPVTAQETGDSQSGYSGDPSGSPTGRSPSTQVASVPQLATRLSQMKNLCTATGGYVVDCLAERIETLGLDAANMNGHTELKQILRETAEELRLLARANSDKTAARARISSNDGQRSARPLVAVTPERRASAQRQAIAILQEAETKLLRSSTQSAARASQYQQVAAALGSNKVLLRS